MHTEPDAAGSFIEQARRAQIVQSTIEVLAEQGYGAASFARIAQRASISPGLITYHFQTKDALISAVLATVEGRLDAAMANPEGEEPESYPAALEGMLRRFAEHCRTHGGEISAMTAIRREVQGEAVRQAVARTDRRGSAELVAFIREGQEHGQFRAVDPALYATVLMSAMGEFPRFRADDVEEQRRVAADWVSLFVNAISTTAGPGEDTDPADPTWSAP
ncbi:TetR/AcrR family transcriptional regulator [Actinosynnema sp. NPDC050436]|uniref:TetR/AcrR family transcriptional regulator n=1 Tax=Actinosynnema sp. NPDC050436 TaxID=3155659 RepID=UPI0033D1B610